MFLPDRLSFEQLRRGSVGSGVGSAGGLTSAVPPTSGATDLSTSFHSLRLRVFGMLRLSELSFALLPRVCGVLRTALCSTAQVDPFCPASAPVQHGRSLATRPALTGAARPWLWPSPLCALVFPSRAREVATLNTPQLLWHQGSRRRGAALFLGAPWIVVVQFSDSLLFDTVVIHW